MVWETHQVRLIHPPSPGTPPFRHHRMTMTLHYGPQVHFLQLCHTPPPMRTCQVASIVQPPTAIAHPPAITCLSKSHSQRREPNDKHPLPPTHRRLLQRRRTTTPVLAPVPHYLHTRPCSLSHRPTLPLLPATHLSRHMHSTDTRCRGSSSGMHCDVAKGHRLANGPQAFVRLCRRPPGHVNGPQGFVCVYKRVWGADKAPGRERDKRTAK